MAKNNNSEVTNKIGKAIDAAGSGPIDDLVAIIKSLLPPEEAREALVEAAFKRMQRVHFMEARELLRVIIEDGHQTFEVLCMYAQCTPPCDNNDCNGKYWRLAYGALYEEYKALKKSIEGDDHKKEKEQK